MSENKKIDWKNKEDRNSYFRELMRQRRGIKRHANIMEDGSLWSDNHPYGKFDTNEERLQNMRENRKSQSKRTVCHLCNKSYYMDEFEKHNFSKAHLLAVKDLNVPFF